MTLNERLELISEKQDLIMTEVFALRRAVDRLVMRAEEEAEQADMCKNEGQVDEM